MMWRYMYEAGCCCSSLTAALAHVRARSPQLVGVSWTSEALAQCPPEKDSQTLLLQEKSRRIDPDAAFFCANLRGGRLARTSKQLKTTKTATDLEDKAIYLTHAYSYPTRVLS